MWPRTLALSQGRHRLPAEMLRAQDTGGPHRTARGVSALRVGLRPSGDHQATACVEDSWRESLLAIGGRASIDGCLLHKPDGARSSLQTKLLSLADQIQAVESRIAESQEQLDELLLTRLRISEKLLGKKPLPKDDNADPGPIRENWSSQDFPWSGKLRSALNRVFGLESFLPMQMEAMNASMSGRDVILITTTGGGKSLCYQLPALLSPGITVVISPLLSLIEDQIMNLKKYAIEARMLGPAASWDTALEVYECLECGGSDFKLLYVTPEKLSKSKKLMSLLDKCYKAGNLSRIAVDEVHCVSQWGNDFRPDYRTLGILKRQFPETPIMGVTATATPRVTEDTKDILNIKDAVILRSPLRRDNLFYEVRLKPSEHQKTLDDMEKAIKCNFEGQSGIVYCLSRRNCTDVSRGLNRRDIKSATYHAGMTNEERRDVHEKWLNNEIQVVCATVAFGMGINKPDVRFVFHHSLSKSIENYFQESGRAGRDGKPAHCLLYFGFSDAFRQKGMVFAEATGLDNLDRMREYCTSTSRCRQRLLTQHFGEIGNESACAGKCDVCSGLRDDVNRDVTAQCRALLKIVQGRKSAKLDTTAVKLVKVASGRRRSEPRYRALRDIAKEDLQTIILRMIEKGFLKDEFRLTPYQKVCYLIPGPNASKLATVKVTMDMWRITRPDRNAFKEWVAEQSADSRPESDGQKYPPPIQDKPKNDAIATEQKTTSNIAYLFPNTGSFVKNRAFDHYSPRPKSPWASGEDLCASGWRRSLPPILEKNNPKKPRNSDRFTDARCSGGSFYERRDWRWGESSSLRCRRSRTSNTRKTSNGFQSVASLLRQLE